MLHLWSCPTSVQQPSGTWECPRLEFPLSPTGWKFQVHWSRALMWCDDGIQGSPKLQRNWHFTVLHLKILPCNISKSLTWRIPVCNFCNPQTSPSIIPKPPQNSGRTPKLKHTPAKPTYTTPNLTCPSCRASPSTTQTLWLFWPLGIENHWTTQVAEHTQTSHLPSFREQPKY